MAVRKKYLLNLKGLGLIREF